MSNFPFEVAKREIAPSEETPRKSSRGGSTLSPAEHRCERKDLRADGLVHISQDMVLAKARLVHQYFRRQ